MTELPGIRRVEQIMGMPIIVDARDPDTDERLLDDVFNWFRLVDATFSTYKSDSEIARLNRGELTLGECSADVRWVIARCRELRDETHGYFDADAVTPPDVDPSGLVKGWSVDHAATLLAKAGLTNYAINAGGDIRVRGGALPNPRWRVGIEHPTARNRVAAVIETDELAVATSGASTRGDHVVNPHTRRPPQGVLSVTIAGPDITTADAYATAAFAMGTDGPEWTRTLRPYEAMTITASGKTLSTAGFPAERQLERSPGGRWASTGAASKER